MEVISAQVQTLANNTDDAGRNNILVSLRDLQRDVEKPIDTLLNVYNSHLQVAVLHAGVELGLFEELAKEDVGTLTVTKFAEKSGASPDLLNRLLRYLSSVGYLVNVTPDQFQANKMTRIFASPIASAGLIHSFDTCSPAIQAFPSFLASTSYRDITSNTHTPFQVGHYTTLPAFDWLSQQPKLFGAMQTVMGALQSSDWMIGFDLLEEEARSVPSSPPEETERPFFIDLGGGHGHQCIQLQEKYPHLSGRLVLQDLPQAVDKLPPIEGLKVMAQDFFERQAVEGATFYYLRRILHDWPDTSCVQILQNLKAAMSLDSRLLIDEVVLPDVGVHWHAAMADISMGILFGGKERTREQWEGLVEKAGLKLAWIHTYKESTYNSIIVLEVE